MRFAIIAPLAALLFSFSLGPECRAAIETGSQGREIPSRTTPTTDDDQTTSPGTLYVEPSTLHSVGFQWRITGDANRNGRVAVRFRQRGAQDWREGLDLLRIRGEKVGMLVEKQQARKEARGKATRQAAVTTDAGPQWEYVCGNLYAGSILFLVPGTEYEVQLHLHDPDNGDTAITQELVVATKSEPQRAADGRRLHVYPAEHSGEKASPTFADFAAAYAQCGPGDAVVLHAGNYSGAYVLDRKATRERPIVICAAGDGPVVFQGDPSGAAGKVVKAPVRGTDDFHWHDARIAFDVSQAEYHWFEGLTLRNYEQGIGAGAAARTIGLTVRRCTFEDSGWAGVLIRSPRCRDLLVADCFFRGTQGTWMRSEEKPWPYKGVWIAGQGVDVCYNRVQNHKDGLSVYGKGRGEDFAETISAIDFHHNDVGQSWDDNEADGGQHNIRYFLNRFVDQHVGFSAQPIYGGPCYFVRNVQYNVTRGVVVKSNLQPAGVFVLHNTSFSCGEPGGITGGYSNSQFLNNAFFGLSGPTLETGPVDPERSRIDWNGYTPTEAPRRLTFDAETMRVRGKKFRSLADLATATGFERNGREIAWSDVVNVPSPPGESKTHADLNFGDPRPKPGSKLVDAALRLPSINDDLLGQAPDLGAFEAEQPLPHFGPRK